MQVTRDTVEAALRAAGRAHHGYESNALGGVRDEQWPGWYAAYVLGRLGDFAPPTRLAAWLEAVEGSDWWGEAAKRVTAELEAARRIA